MTLEIRPERPADRAAIHGVNAAAFPTRAEADLVDRLRKDGDLVLSLVGEVDRTIVGHVAFSRLTIEGGDGPVKGVALAPVAVLPQWHHQGLGSALIERGLARLAEAGEELVFVLGDPAFYGRFGFEAESAAGFSCAYSGPYLQLRRLSDSHVTSGRLSYPSAFAS